MIFQPSCIALILGLLLATPVCATDADKGFVPLFDGKTLQGWKQLGGKAKYAVEDGQIVGTSVANTPNSFLCTERTYGDFILSLEYKVNRELNSGVQIRSEYDKEKNRVFGYQVEIDPSPRAWSGGIFDEGRRGWLFDLKDKPECAECLQAERMESVPHRVSGRLYQDLDQRRGGGRLERFEDAARFYRPSGAWRREEDRAFGNPLSEPPHQRIERRKKQGRLTHLPRDVTS